MLEAMLETFRHPAIQRAVIACVMCGAGCAILSVFVVLMKMPLIGVSMSHAAFAGAVFGLILDINPFLSGLVVCLLTAGLLGPISDRTRMGIENVLGIMFSFLIAFAFLGMGILTRTKAEALNLMWGSLLTLSETDVLVVSVITFVLLMFVILFFKEIRAVAFNRKIAMVSGIQEKMIYYCLLFLTGAVVSSNLTTIGGLLIFALLVQPGATALQLTYNLKTFFLISIASGIGSCLLGLMLSYFLDIPSGASVVLTATAVFAVSYICSPKSRTVRSRKEFCKRCI